MEAEATPTLLTHRRASMPSLPRTFTAGVTFAASLTSEYSAPEWSLSLHLRGPSAIDVDGDGDGTTFTFEASASETTDWAPGLYSYVIRGTDVPGNVVDVECGQVTIAPDVVAAMSHDARSHAQKMVETIEAVLENTATVAQRSYRIGDRELERMPPSELIKLLAHYRNEVASEEGVTRRLGRRHRVRMQ